MNSDYKNASSFRYLFTNTEYSDLPSLTRALAACWDEGKNELFTGALAEYFTSIDKDLAKIALQAADAYRAAPQDADWIFLDFLFLYKTCFLLAYSFEENRCWLIVWILRYKFTLDSPLKNTIL